MKVVIALIVLGAIFTLLAYLRGLVLRGVVVGAARGIRYGANAVRAHSAVAAPAESNPVAESIRKWTASFPEEERRSVESAVTAGIRQDRPVLAWCVATDAMLRVVLVLVEENEVLLETASGRSVVHAGEPAAAARDASGALLALDLGNWHLTEPRPTEVAEHLLRMLPRVLILPTGS